MDMVPHINAAWWEHLTPKTMHARRLELQTLLQRWCKSDYGKHWLSSALTPHGVIRAKVGQAIPVFHVVALGQRKLFVLPQERVRQGHRFVGSTEFKSGVELENSEIPVSPIIRLDLVTDPVLIGHAERLEAPRVVKNVTQPSTVMSIPAHYLLASELWPKKSFVLYQHIFGEGGSYPDDGWFYVGITTRSWQRRWTEHRRAVRSGSKLLFHRKLRDELAAERVTYIHHKVMGITDDLEKLYATEEMLIHGHWEDKRRLNMIPGGQAGLRVLKKRGVIKSESPAPESREAALSQWIITGSEIFD